MTSCFLPARSRAAASHARCAAANLIVCCREKGWDKFDKVPKALPALREILDRLIGKPQVYVNVTHDNRSLEEVRAECLEALRADRGLVLELVGALADRDTDIREAMLLRIGGGVPAPPTLRLSDRERAACAADSEVIDSINREAAR